MVNYFSKIPVWCLAGVMLGMAGPAPAENHTHVLQITRMERLDVIVIGHDDLTSEVEVDGKGYIKLPLIGRIRAGGKTLDALQDDIVQALRAKEIDDPMVMVDVLFHRQFSIQGHVKRPGDYFHTMGMTVEMAVAIAGGFTALANDEMALLTRSSDEEKPPLEVRLNTRVGPGDSIEIERRLY